LIGGIYLLDKSLVHDVLTALLSTGGDFAEVFVENSERNSIVMVNKLVEKANWGVDYGCGLRIIHGTSAVYAYTNRTDRDSLLKLAKEAAQAVKAKDKASNLNTLNRLVANDIHPVAIHPSEVNKKDVVERLRAAANASYAYDPLITQTENSYLSVVQDILVANSKGLWAEDRRTRTRLMAEAVASSENEKQTAYLGPGAKRGYEFVEGTDMTALGRRVAETAVTMLKADLCPSGRMPVLIDNGFGGVIFHEACAHSLEATFIAKKASVFTDKLNEMIAGPAVNAIDDGTIPNEWGSINIDDEGAPGARNVLIENGVLKSYMVDYLNGLKIGMPSTGNGRRESYKYSPTSRMTNTYIVPGTEKPEAVIGDTPEGLYAKQMGGGSVNPATGEFNFAVLEGYMIRNGKIAEPVRGATLIGKGSEVLLNIDRVADNLAMGQGMCGSESGSVPTNVGQPLIRVKEMTVGGRK
jgi:TldD protein